MKKNINTPLFTTLFFVPILVIALSLRLYQLGADSFWCDEAGVAMATAEKSLYNVILIAKSHAAAMPLDYIVTWLFGKLFGLGEFSLRMPSVLWGTLALIPIYHVVKKLSNHSLSLFVAFFTAVSPLGIQYSQELRFYSALLFFYYLSTYLLFKAMENNSIKSWAWAVCVTITGCYFHIYNILALLNGIAYLLILDKNTPFFQSIKNFFIPYTFIVLSVIPGYLYFCLEGVYDYGFNLRDAFVTLLIGSGIFSNNPALPTFAWLFHCEIAALSLLGVFLIFTTKQKRIIAIMISLLLQISMILLADYRSNYFAAARQFIMCFPIMILFFGYSLYFIYTSTSESKQKNYTKTVNKYFSIVLAVFLILFNIPANIQYYQTKKGLGREIAYEITSRYQPGDQILVVPSWNAVVLKYYFLHDLYHEDIVAHLSGFDAENDYNASNNTNDLFFMINRQNIIEYKDFIDDNDCVVSMGEFEQYKSIETLYICIANKQNE